jgi:hypothetical protein
MLLTGTNQLSKMESLHQILMQQGVTTYLMESEVLKPSLDPTEAEGQWKWHTTALGRAIAIHRPQGEWEVVQ